jgi:signal transduction histidine kinase
MRQNAIAIVLSLSACAGPPAGVALEAWERAPAPHPEADAPERVPADLEWEPITAPYLVFAAGDGATWLRAPVRCEPAWRDPVVFAPKTYVGLAAYVDGRRVGSRLDYRHASGTPWYVVPLGCETEHVTFRLTSRYTQIGFPETPRAGDRAAFIAQLLPNDLPRIVIAILFLFIGVASAVLALGSRERRALVGLGIYALALAGWTLFHTRSKQLWAPATDVWFGVWWVSVPTISTGLALYLDAIFGPGPYKSVRALWISLAVVSALAALSLVLGDEAFTLAAAPIFVVGRTLSVLGTLVVTAHLGRLAWRGEREAAIFLAGVLLAFVAAVRDIALSFHLIEGADTWTQYGYALVGVALVLIVRRRVVRMQQQLAEYAESLDRYVRERDALMKDLHDGLGGIVTNVRMLADRGREKGDGGSVLGPISRLAAEGITELRTLIFGFEGLPQSWRQVAAELRRTGSSALEPLEIAHDFGVVIADDAPRPELAVVVDVMRVHREALTNALKHSGASAVKVRFDVDATSLALEVRDDGSGMGASAGEPGVGMNKGLASMRARARGHGGELTIDEDGGTRVRLRIPW